MSSTHVNPLGFKTDCPPSVLWDLIRGWVETHPVTRKLEPDSPAARILGAPSSVKANFTRVLGAISASKQAKQARFLPNPEPNWGPRPKHGRPVRVRGWPGGLISFRRRLRSLRAWLHPPCDHLSCRRGALRQHWS